MLQFLQAVLPSTGGYVLTIGTPKPDGTGQWFKNFHCDTIPEMVQTALKLDGPPAKRTVFFALANFRNNIDEEDKVRRTQDHAFQFKTLAFDVDPKDRHENVLYATQQDMARTVLAACATLGLPDPVFVSSGNGIHCYYPLIQEISKEHWRRASELLRAALLSTGMQLDTTKVCDPSMVLRPIDTHNKKTDPYKVVKLLSPLQLFDPVDLITRLLKATGKTQLSPARGAGPKRASAIADAILHTEFPPTDSKIAETKCPQLTAIAAAGGVVDEPMWYAGLGIAAYSTEPRETAIRWSSKHPKYTEAETLTKMAQWKANSGPTTCQHFEKLDSKPCSTCPHRGKIGSPVQLGVPMNSDPVTTAPTAPNMVLPVGYMVKGDRIFRRVGDETFPVSDYLMFPTRRYRDPDTLKSMCLLDVKLPIEGWVTRELPMDSIAAGAKDWSGWLLNNQIFVHSEEILKATRRYIMNYLQELQLETESEVMCSSFGWIDETFQAFALGERVITKDATLPVRLGPMAAQYAPHMAPKGDYAKWCEATSVFSAPGLEYHALVFLMQTGSPIMVGSGLKSVLVNMYSPDSGTGKSSTGAFANSMYGAPEKLQLTVEDTQNATFKSMGVYGNLPVYIDEITTIDSKRLSQTVYFITQGREKKRMSKDGGFQQSVEWENISTSSSNQDLYEKIGERMSVEGEAMRILQFPFDRNVIFSASGGQNIGFKLAMFLKDNYALAGEHFLRGIITAGGPFVLFENALADFNKKFKFDFTGKERYWQAAMVVAYASGKLGSALGIFKFDVDAVIRKGLTYIATLRREINEAHMDCFDILGVYLGEHSSKTAVHMTNSSVSRVGKVLLPYPNEAVARVEVTRTQTNPFASGRLFINQVHFNRWCHERGADVKNFFAQLVQHQVVFHKERRINLMRGTDKPLPAMRCFEIIMNHQRFVEILQQNDIGETGPDLKLVGGTAA